MDTWAYSYRLPVFEQLHKQVEIEVFFSRPKPFNHLDPVSLKDCSFKLYSGNWLFALMPVQLLWKKYDVYMVGQIGIQSVIGAFFTLLVSGLRKKPLVLWTDYIETEHYRKAKRIKKFFGDFIRGKFINRCAAAMGFGVYTENYLTKMGGGRLPIFNVVQVVPEVCNKDVGEVKKKAEYEGKVVLLYMGYLRKRKGVDFLIKAFKEMERTDAVLIIAGSGEEERYLKRLACDSGSIRFVGYVEGDEKAGYYSQADVFIMPTEHDPWGLVVNEAMYYGLPIIVTGAAGSSELVTDNGVVIESGNSSMLKDALVRLIEDEDLRKSMGKKSKTYISKYGVEYAANSFMQVIRCVSDKSLCQSPDPK